ncbi:MAG: DUF2793 domain-containing protein [Zavarzinia sp.]|nr:DUF2793 domain-containing protein [Zavarzinia sp.]
MPTPRLALPYIVQSQAQKEVTHNEALNLLDIMVQAAVLDRDRLEPPAAPVAGACHIVAAGATGAWAGQAGSIAVWIGTAWRFVAPWPGFQAYVASEGLHRTWDGAGWIVAGGDIAIGAVSGLADALDGKLDVAAIGASVQGHDPVLDALAALDLAADRLIHATGADTLATSLLTALGRALAGADNGAAARGLIGAAARPARDMPARRHALATAWTVRTSPADLQWQGVCWSPELGLLCAVAGDGSGNRVATSSDGVNWTSRASAVDNIWSGVCWSAECGIFCAIANDGAGNRVMTSPDGITWTARTSAADNIWSSICWSAERGLFCAVATSGTGNRVMTSPDGITWTARASAADNSWFSVCWSAELGLFCAVAYTGAGNRVMTSPDGIAWTARASAADNNWLSVCWSPDLGLFCAVANSGTGNRVMTSPDGIAWTLRASAADNAWRAVVWAAELGLLCAIANSGTGNRVMTSADGISWIIGASAADNNWRALCWAGALGLFCATGVSGAGARMMTSPVWPGHLSRRRNIPGYAARGDASAVLTPGLDGVFQHVTATLTADRVLTLSATGAVAGDLFEIRRGGGGAFTLAIVDGGPAGGTLRTGSAGLAFTGRYVFSGSNWVELSFLAA